MIIYSEHGKAIGATRRSPCGCMTELVLQAEPFSEPHTYRLDRDDDNERWLVKAKSVLENGLWVDVAEVRENEAGLPTLSLLRIRPNYTGRRRRPRERRTTN